MTCQPQPHELFEATPVELPDPLPIDYERQSTAELLECCKDLHWRLFSGQLYKSMTKDDEHQEGSLVPFRTNAAQRQFMMELNNCSVVLKARQLWFCLERSTRVFTADLRWVGIDTLQPGDEVVSVDEHVRGGRESAHKMRAATIQAVKPMRRMGYRITFADEREVVCTEQHPWLARSGQKRQPFWRAMDRNVQNAERKPAVGHQVRSICKQ
ncbi:MAG: Hint domain-containing protein [Paracoccaceae bacterium]